MFLTYLSNFFGSGEFSFCAEYSVAIELNANPRRLVMDRRYLDYCIEKNVLISINPDAHSVNAFQHIKYGALAAQKAGIVATQNLSSFSLGAFESLLKKQHTKRTR